MSLYPDSLIYVEEEMKLSKVNKEIFYNYDTDMTEEEWLMFRNYADDNISISELDDMMVNWALVDILKKQITVHALTKKKGNNGKKTKKG
jgi:hypothetical protein